VLVSGVFGWIMLSAVVLAIPDMDQAAAQGGNAFYWTIDEVLPNWLATVLYSGIGIAQYLCGLATVTSASRMAYAFARDGGLPFSAKLRQVSSRFRTPAAAIWSVSVLCVAFAAYTPVYSTITTVCVMLLYVSYVIPTTIGLATFGRGWTRMGPWNLGWWFKPLAVVCIGWSHR
jgi:amino acid transporter